MILKQCVCNTTPVAFKRRRSDTDTLTRGNWFSDRSASRTNTNWVLHEGNVELTSEKMTIRQKRASKAAAAQTLAFGLCLNKNFSRPNTS